MRKIFRPFGTPLVLLFLFSFAAAAQDTSREAQKADEVVNAYVRQGRFSGAVLIAKDGKVILSKGYGMANYELDVANTPQTKFRLGSITKQFTSMAIAQLVERGLLKVEDPISKYLPTIPKEIGDKVTVYHLLTHTSGIPSFTNSPDYQARIRFENFSGDKLIAWLQGKAFEFEPGSNFKYNNSGYFLLGHLVEKVSGKPYDQYLRENIFGPLGMNDTGYDFNNVVIKNRASGYIIRNGRLENADYLNMTVPGGAGALYSTVEDLYKWDRALYTEKLVKRATLEKVFTPFKSNYGWGWFIEDVKGRKRIAHSGGIDGFNTILFRYVDQDVCLIALSNRNTNVLDGMAQRFAAILFGEAYELPKEETPAASATRREIKVDARVLDTYVGEYEIAPGFTITVTREGERLMAQATGQSKFELFAESEVRFFLKVTDAQVAFVKDGSGAVDKLVLYQSGREMPGKKIK